jgi:hypothetical protein
LLRQPVLASGTYRFLHSDEVLEDVKEQRSWSMPLLLTLVGIIAINNRG